MQDGGHGDGSAGLDEDLHAEESKLHRGADFVVGDQDHLLDKLLDDGEGELARRLGAERSRLLERTDLDADYIRAVVRNGINSMPWYTRTDLSDRQIEAIAAYLMRNNVQRN